MPLRKAQAVWEGTLREAQALAETELVLQATLVA